MLSLIFRRLLQLPLIVGVIYTITLALAWAVPGNPLDHEGRRPPEEVQKAMMAQYNLDSFWGFYGTYLDSATGIKWVRKTFDGSARREAEAAHAAGISPPDRRVFDLGPSLQYRDRRVNEIIADTLPVSVTLGAVAILIAVFIGVTAGVIGAVKPGSWADNATLSVALVGISLPSFVIGTMLLLIFGVWMPLFPVAERGGAGDYAESAVCGVHRAADADGDDRLSFGGLHSHRAGQGVVRVERADEARAQERVSAGAELSGAGDSAGDDGVVCRRAGV